MLARLLEGQLDGERDFLVGREVGEFERVFVAIDDERGLPRGELRIAIGAERGGEDDGCFRERNAGGLFERQQRGVARRGFADVDDRDLDAQVREPGRLLAGIRGPALGPLVGEDADLFVRVRRAFQ